MSFTDSLLTLEPSQTHSAIGRTIVVSLSIIFTYRAGQRSKSDALLFLNSFLLQRVTFAIFVYFLIVNLLICVVAGGR